MLQDHKAEGETEMTEIHEIRIGYRMEYTVVFENCFVPVISKGKFTDHTFKNYTLGAQMANNKGCLTTEFKSYRSLLSG